MQDIKLLKKQEDKKFDMGRSEIKYDNRGRETVYEVQHNGVSIDWSVNVSEALASHKATIGSKLFAINMATGRKVLHG